MKRIVLLAAALCLFGCNTNPQWSKQGVPSAQAAQDYAECSSLAQEATQRDTNIDTDILASRGTDWQRTDVISQKRTGYVAQTQDVSDDIIHNCMISKGFVPGS